MKFRKHIGGKYQETVEFRFRDIEVIADAAYIKTKSGVMQCIDCDDEEHNIDVILGTKTQLITIEAIDNGNSPKVIQWSREFNYSKESLPTTTTKGVECVNLLDYQKHIFDERESNIQGKKVTICGEPSSHWDFLSIDHAFNTIVHGSHLLPCPKCKERVIEILKTT